MNADSLPLGFALIRVVRTQPDGSTDTAGIFTIRSIAESLARKLKNLFPENKYDVVEDTPVLPGLKGKI